MIKVGTDIVEISRFSEMERIDAFLNKYFTENERKYFEEKKNPFESIAGTYAGKEAFSKYLGSGVRGFSLADIEVLHNELKKPYIKFKGENVSADVSISHSENYAVAVVCGEEYRDADENMGFYKKLLPKRFVDMNKGDCGRVFIIGGSVGMLGAPCLCAKGAMRCGSGLVMLGTPECIQPYASIKLDEGMTCPLKCEDGMISEDALPEIRERLKACDVCAVGPGLGRGDSIIKAVEEVLKNDKPCVIDADGINALSSNIDLLKAKNCQAVLTPHPGEMARLTGLSINEIQADREAIALKFAKEYNCILLLKGNKTVIASPDGRLHINESGNNGMASGGMGDVLTGVIASFIGQGADEYSAAVLGAYVHGLAGDIGAEEIGEYGLIAGDVIEKLGVAIKEINK